MQAIRLTAFFLSVQFDLTLAADARRRKGFQNESYRHIRAVSWPRFSQNNHVRVATEAMIRLAETKCSILNHRPLFSSGYATGGIALRESAKAPKFDEISPRVGKTERTSERKTTTVGKTNQFTWCKTAGFAISNAASGTEAMGINNSSPDRELQVPVRAGSARHVWGRSANRS